MYLLYGQIIIRILNIMIENKAQHIDCTNLVKAQMELDRAYQPTNFRRHIYSE